MRENKDPLVSVLMPVYNAEKYINEAIESILNQTFSDFEFLIINDGSDDNSEKVILSYSDPRIKYYKNSVNLGLIETLNRAINLAKGKYLARMDSDDISLPERFERQINYLELHQEVGVCGSFLKTFGQQNRIWKTEILHSDILAKMFVDCSIWHPTAVIRKSILNESNVLYDRNFIRCEDYKLWTDLSLVTRFYNIPHVLYLYRFHDKQESKKKNNVNDIRTILTAKLLDRSLTEREIELNEALHFLKPFQDIRTLEEVKHWVKYLKERNEYSGTYNRSTFNRSLDFKLKTLHQQFFLFQAGSNKKLVYNNLLHVFSLKTTFKEFSVRERLKILLKWTLQIVGVRV